MIFILSQDAHKIKTQHDAYFSGITFFINYSSLNMVFICDDK
jgi:hypothetical protein